MTDREKLYHWANVIIISFMLLIFLIFLVIGAVDSNAEIPGAIEPIFNVGAVWILISGVINKDIREFVIKSFTRFWAAVISQTVIVSCLTGGFALIVGLIIIAVIFMFIWAIGIVLLGGYLLFTSAKALKIAQYFE